MKVEKNGKSYDVSETADKWVLKSSSGKVDIKYEVSKRDCTTIEDLQKFITENDI